MRLTRTLVWLAGMGLVLEGAGTAADSRAADGRAADGRAADSGAGDGRAGAADGRPVTREEFDRVLKELDSLIRKESSPDAGGHNSLYAFASNAAVAARASWMRMRRSTRNPRSGST